MTGTVQLVLMDALEKHPSVYPDPRISHAVALLPPCWFLFYVLTALFYRFIVPTSVKNRLRMITQDSVTLDDLPEGPTPREIVRWKAVLSTVLSAARLAVGIVLLVRLLTMHNDRDVLTLIERALGVSAWTIATIYILLRPSITPIYGLLLFYILDIVAVAYSLLITSSFRSVRVDTMLDVLRASLSVCLVLVTASLPTTSHAVSAKMASRKDTPTCSLDSPEDNTSLSSWLRVSWMAPLLSIAYKRTLNDSDVWQLSPVFQTANIYPVFKRILGQSERPSLLWRITKFTAFDLVVTTLCSLVIAFFSFSFPYFLKKILEALTSTDPELRARAYHLALLAFVVNVLQQLVELIRAWHSRRSYERVRGVLITMVFEKATRKKDTSGSVGHRQLEKDEEEASGSDSGRIMNLMNGDAYAVGQWFWEVSLIVRAPIELTVALIFLYQILGWSSLVGLSAVSVAVIILKYLVDRNLALTRGMLAATDRRISVISELVSSIRLLKHYAWESIWVDKAVEAREKELAIRYKSNLNGAWIYFVMTITPRIINFLAFLSYTKLAHRDLTIPVAFAGIAVFNIVQMHLATLPGRVMFLLRTLISIRRLDKYLGEEEVERTAGATVPQTGSDSIRLGFEASTFQYPQHEVRDETAETFSLVCPVFDFPLGRLTLVAGDNASGKSSLLMALLGEMDCTSGRLYRPANRHAFALVTQDSWSEQATILDNILFGAPYDEKRFDEVVEACALGPDLAAWEGREHTEVGERGISLSGGQRARVALARAVYSSASVLLLDDPLSAVDAHTARHLVEKCFGGPLLKDRTVVLVTHHIKLCTPVASLIVRMTAGTASLQEVDRTNLVSEASSLDDAEEDDTAVASPSGKKSATGASTPASRISPMGGLITKENRAEGSVKWKVYGMYLRAAGIETWIGILATLLAARALEVGQQWLLKAWGESYNRVATSSLSIHDLLPPASENVNSWLGVYLAVAFLNAFVVLVRLAFSYHGSFKAARSLLYACLSRVTNAPSRWLDQNPTGRLLNRFTADISAVDSTVNNSITDVLSQGIGFIASLLAVVYVVPRFLIFALFAIVLYTIMGTPYVRCSRDLRRLENNHRSPLFSRFGGLLRGLKVVRAFGQEQRYLKMLMTELDLFQAMDHFFWTARFYLALRFDVLGSLAIYVVTLAALGGAVSQGDAAFAIVLTYQFVGGLHETFYSYAKLELDVNSIERIHDLLSTPQEPPAIIEKNRPPAHWPARGEITIDNLAVRYAPHLPPALNGISAHIRPGEKIGIVGRTGSGKTTLALSLLRITDPYAGSITIDGLDITQMGLRDLRERVTIISQESTLFEGTIRSNLDPRSDHSDADLWDVLRRVGMARSPDSREEDAARLVKSLDAPVTTGAENFSQGERQLISIARALLRRSNVFIADEATASVDFATDERVQRTLRQELAHCTVLTIAHRLRTVIDVDRVLLLQNGVVIEFDAPRKLLADKDSAFRELCAQSNELEELIRLAGIE